VETGCTKISATASLTDSFVSDSLLLVVAYEDQVLDALGDPTRRAVLKRLRAGARSVGEIAEGMEVSRPAVSQHLKVLKTARLVTVHAMGTRRVYAVDKRGIEALRDWLDGFWSEALMAFKAAAEREASEEMGSRKSR
jgi:DNA-binding transcriptional ArsR family regulator